MDFFISNAMISSLKKSGGVGYTKPGAVLTFDGDTTNKVMIFEELEAVKIFDDFLDLNNIKRIECILRGEKIFYEKTALEIVEDDGILGVSVTAIHIPPVLAIRENTQGAEPGVYANIACVPEFYVTRIEFAETVHPIDPKYLPGVCLPVVDITSGDPASGGTIILTPAESAMLDKAAKNGVPIVANMIFNGWQSSFVMTLAKVEDGYTFFCMVSNTGAIRIHGTSEGWLLYLSMAG